MTSDAILQFRTPTCRSTSSKSLSTCETLSMLVTKTALPFTTSSWVIFETNILAKFLAVVAASRLMATFLATDGHWRNSRYLE